nr:hypothetical protein [Tanacetum cinerariifolium]
LTETKRKLEPRKKLQVIWWKKTVRRS